MNKLSRTLVIIGLFLGIVGAGVGVAALLILTKPKPKKSDKPKRTVPVEIHVVKSSTQPLRVIANGTVISAQEISVQPEVTGRVVWKSPDLVPGGRVNKGDPLLRIDPRDYAAAVAQQKAQLEGQRLALEQERSRRVIAKREWNLFGDAGVTDADPDALGRALALREPHLRSAKASLAAAEAALDRSRITLSRTLINAPFNAFVRDESVDLGQVVSPNARLGTLVGTDAFWVQASVSIDKLPWIRVPGLNAETGSSAVVMQKVGDGIVERNGSVIRLYGDLDPMGRMARVLVEVPKPLRADQPVEAAGVREGDAPAAPSAMPMLIGAYVRVAIDAGEVDDVFEVPRAGLHEGNVVYVADGEDKLQTRRPEIIWRREGSMLVRGDLKTGDRVIVSQLATPLEGMDLRIESNAAAASAKGKTGSSSRPEEKTQ